MADPKDQTDAVDEDEDPVVRELDVYLATGLGGQL
jgi:hypothetical protein